MPGGFSHQQRLVFGRAAELYDEIRPGYPPAILDALMSTAGLERGDRVFDVGAGTGKGTHELARRGLDVLAIEPDADMARTARRRFASVREVRVMQVGFEEVRDLAPRKALVSFQAWHWTQPELRYGIAHRLLCPGGTLAAVWTFPVWDYCPPRARLAAAYTNSVPDMASDFPMHPASHPTALAGDWASETTQAQLFTGPLIRSWPWEQRYTAAQYLRLLQTHQDHMLLPDEQRRRLLDAIHDTISTCGGAIDLPLISYLCTTTRADESSMPGLAGQSS